MEFAGSLGDLGTLIPLSVALITICGLSFTTVLLAVGLFYIVIGFYYRLPIPVQPLKVVSAIAIAFPEKITLPMMSATGLIFGATLLLLAFSGIIDRIAKIFTKPIVRGIQTGLGLILIMKGIAYIRKPELFISNGSSAMELFGVPVNLIIGIAGVALVLALLTSKRFPAALVIVFAGIIAGIAFGALNDLSPSLGPTEMRLYMPTASDFANALFLLVIPQIPLTIGNAIIGTTDAAKSMFGEGETTARATNRAFSTSMGLANIVVGAFGGMPVCHGAGGLAAHYRFGARTGGSNMMIGTLFVVIALVFGRIGVDLLTSIPNSVLGVLLLFAGLELAMLMRDLKERKDIFIVFLIAGIALATTNMSIAFGFGIAAHYIMKWAKIEI